MPRATTNNRRDTGAMMRRAYLLITTSALLCTAVAACASDFTLVATPIGGGKWSYSLTNNSITLDVVEWTLHWNPNDWMDDLNQGLANFDSGTGVVAPIPALWYQVPAVYPWFGTGGSYGAIKHGGGQKGGFVVKYGTPSNQNPVMPQWFVVWYEDGANRVASAAIPITESVVPEPAAVVTLALPALALLAVLRKRLS